MPDSVGRTPPLDGPGATERSASPASKESPSLAFLRAVAQVSDAVPSPFDRVAPPGARFAVRRRLGEGGFGVVYEVFDLERRATVALKVLRRGDGPSISRFKSEFRSLVGLVHRNLVQLYELHHERHAEGEVWLFTMELVQGGDALSYVRPRGGPFDEARLRAVFCQLATGLAFLHGSGWLHRDVKPSNVRVTDEGRAVLVDFGLIEEIAEPLDQGRFAGTPSYMAPERIAGLPSGEASDWYAVGVMLYQALTGELPAPADIAPSARAPGIPADLDRLCAELLAQAPHERPSGREVVRRLAGSGVEPCAVASGQELGGGEAPFIGRAAQLAALRQALVASQGGVATVVLVRGRSGVGKSALLRRFLDETRAGDPARLILFGRCFEQESVPYKGVDGLLEDLSRRLQARRPICASSAEAAVLGQVFPQLRDVLGLPPAPPPEGDETLRRPRAFAALRALLAQVAPRGVVLVVDDLQWGDLDSVAVLAALLQGPAPPLLVCAYRAEEAENIGALRAFFEAIGKSDERLEVRRLEVGALDGHEARALSRLLLSAGVRGQVTEDAVRELVADGQGDPFLLSELTRREPATQPGPTGASAPALDALLAARIGRLPASARRLLELLAIDGQPVARAVAVEAAFGGEEADALGAVGVLRAERLIRSRRAGEDEEILPYHDRIREVVTRMIEPGVGRVHHHRLALALEATGSAEPERLFFHCRGAGRRADAARHAAEAAIRAHEALAFDRAARLYREALALRDGPDRALASGAEEEHRLRVGLAEALAGGGRPHEASKAYLEAGDGAPPERSEPLRLRATEILLGAGYVEEGLTTLRAVLRTLDVVLPTSLWRSLLGFVWLRLRLGVRGAGIQERPTSAIPPRALLRIDACYAATLGYFLINPTLAAETQARHLLLALDAGEPSRVARALAVEALVTAARRGPCAATDRLLAAARALDAQVGQPRLSGVVRLCEAHVAFLGYELRRGHDLLVACEATLRQRCRDASVEIDLAMLHRVNFLWMLGEVAEFRRVVPALIEEAEGRGSRMLEMMLRLGNAPNLALLDGRPDRAREAIMTALERWPCAPGTMLHLRALTAHARIALYEGECDAALAWVDEGFAAIRWTGLRLVPMHNAELWVWGGLAAVSTGDLTRAARCARSLLRTRIPWAEGAAGILEAGIARRRGETARAEACLTAVRERSRLDETALYSAAMARRSGEWQGSAEGDAAVAAADAWMAARGVVEPRRLTAMLMGWA